MFIDEIRPEAHHLIPRVSLKKFARDGKVMVLRHDDGRKNPLEMLLKPRLISYKAAGAKPEFYTQYRRDGTPDRYIEETFSKFENGYRKLLKEVRAGRNLSPQGKDAAALVFALQETRSPRTRKSFSGLFSTLQARARDTFKAYKPDASDAELEEVVAEFSQRTITSSDVSFAPDNLALMSIAPALKTRYTMMRHMNVSILISHAQGFVTSDSPAVWVDPLRRDDDWRGFYFMSLSAEATLPLTPRHCLLFSYMPLQPIVWLEQPELVQIVNARTLVHSCEEIYLEPQPTVAQRLSQLAGLADKERRRVSLLPAAVSPEGGFIVLYDVADSVGADWSEVVARNRRTAAIWNQIGFGVVDLDTVVDMRQSVS